MTRQVERLLKRFPVSWIFAWMYNGLMAHDRLMKTLELFATKVLPRVANAQVGGQAGQAPVPCELSRDSTFAKPSAILSSRTI